MCASLKPGKMYVPVRAVSSAWSRCLRSGHARDFFRCSYGQHLARADGNRFDDLRLVFGKSRAGIDAAVEVNIVGMRLGAD